MPWVQRGASLAKYWGTLYNEANVSETAGDPFHKLESKHANKERSDRLLYKMPRDGEHRLKSFENGVYLMIANPLQRALSLCR